MKCSGFTLIELIIAMAVFSVMAVISYTGLAQVLDNQDILTSQREYQRKLVLAFMRIEDDLDHVRARGIRDIYGEPQGPFIGLAPGTSSITEPTLEFTRGGSPIIVGATPQSDLQRVAYRLDDQGNLSRLSWSVLDRSPVSTAREHVLLTDIKEMEVRFFRADKRWSDSWPPLGGENKGELLPKGMELKIKIGETEITRLFLVHG